MPSVNCAERMRALLKELQTSEEMQAHVEDVQEECPDEWKADYAVIIAQIIEPSGRIERENVDSNRIVEEVVKLATKHFGRSFTIVRQGKPPEHAQNVLQFHGPGIGWQFELEAYRQTPKSARAPRRKR